MAHTPGPWQVIENECGETIVRIPHHNLDIECYANARLIAAAPELLAACKAAAADYYWDHLDSCGIGGKQVEIAQMLHEVIAKAEPPPDYDYQASPEDELCDCLHPHTGCTAALHADNCRQ